MCRRSVALVVMCPSATSALLERKTRLGAVQGLDLTLLVAAQDQRMFRRIEVQARDVQQLLDERRIAIELKGLNLDGLS